jgi:hypothetical protein
MMVIGLKPVAIVKLISKNSKKLCSTNINAN